MWQVKVWFVVSEYWFSGEWIFLGVGLLLTKVVSGLISAKWFFVER